MRMLSLALLLSTALPLGASTTPPTDCDDSKSARLAAMNANIDKAPAGLLVSNVEFFQSLHPDGGSQVVISYDLVSPEGACDITVQVSSDGGATFPITPSTVSGDVGTNVAPGLGKQIIWRISADLPNTVIEEAAIRVVADDGTCTGCLYWSDNNVWAG